MKLPAQNAFAITILIGGVLTGTPVPAEELSARDIMEKNFHVTKIKHLLNDSTMTLTNDKGQQRVRKTHSVNLLQPNGIDSKIMIRFLQPGDVEGTG